MNLLNVSEVENKKLKVKGGQDYTKKVFHINRKDETTINSVLFQDIYNSFSKKYQPENVMVRAVSNSGLFSFKTFGESNLNFKEFHEYFQNKVSNSDQFEYFYSVEITVRNY